MGFGWQCRLGRLDQQGGWVEWADKVVLIGCVGRHAELGGQFWQSRVGWNGDWVDRVGKVG